MLKPKYWDQLPKRVREEFLLHSEQSTGRDVLETKQLRHELASAPLTHTLYSAVQEDYGNKTEAEIRRIAEEATLKMVKELKELTEFIYED